MKWISVKDKLPTTGNDYLVTDGQAQMVCNFDPNTQKWVFWVNFWESEEVTHWMELPAKPN